MFVIGPYPNLSESKSELVTRIFSSVEMEDDPSGFQPSKLQNFSPYQLDAMIIWYSRLCASSFNPINCTESPIFD
ncbi:hypothetical protein HI914_03151 [Erysiphe necator]|nr:hypothetical protein HI914_03151 [Erysiphe necator]